MTRHKTRKQLRLEGEAAQKALAALAALDTPEGLARLIFDKQRGADEAFQNAVAAELERLAEAELEATAGELEAALDEVAEAAGEENDAAPAVVEPAATYRVRHVSGNVIANSLRAEPVPSLVMYIAHVNSVNYGDLSVEPE
jgi:hypothetical protein